MFKSLIPAIVIASAFATPAFAQSQGDSGLTRAQVKAQLAEMEQAGYSPNSDHATYPEMTQAAVQRVAANDSASPAYGTSTTGSSAVGSRTPSAQPARSTYFGQ